MLAKSCNFGDVDARKYQDEVVLGSFIRGTEEREVIRGTTSMYYVPRTRYALD